jgi:hypothetical protein
LSRRHLPGARRHQPPFGRAALNPRIASNPPEGGKSWSVTGWLKQVKWAGLDINHTNIFFSFFYFSITYRFSELWEAIGGTTVESAGLPH